MDKRITDIRRDAGLSQEEFAARLNITANYVWMLEKGQRIPSERLIKSICREFKVREDWLRNGTEPMYDPTRPDELDGILQENGLPGFLRGLFLRYAKLSPAAQKEVDAQITEWATEFAERVKAQATLPGTPAKEETREERIEREAREEAEEYYQLRLEEKRQIMTEGSTLAGTGQSSSNSGENTA